MIALFDIETNGLYWDASVTHCLCLKILGEDRVRGYSDTPCGGEDGTLADAETLLSQCEAVIGHNIIDYDLAVLEKLYGFSLPPTVKVIDTLIFAKLCFPILMDHDMKRVRSGRFPMKLAGRQSLEAWGHRLGIYKGSYCHSTDWAEYNPEMLSYCKQDVEVTHALYSMLSAQDFSQDALDLELRVARIITEQRIGGWPFDLQRARELHLQWLDERDRIDAELQRMIPPFHDVATFLPKRDNRTRGYRAGVPVQRERITPFNPNSRMHVSRFLKERYQWHPERTTDTGQAVVDESVLSQLPYPETRLLAQRFELQKHIGMLAEGDKAWLRLYNSQTGCIHGSIDTLGTRTRRGAHRDPNLGQVPAHSKYGADCRSLFHAPDGWVEVGVDADALELRCLAHFMATYDGGAYAKVVHEGKKANGTDIHTQNSRIICSTRDEAKTFIYAFK